MEAGPVLSQTASKPHRSVVESNHLKDKVEIMPLERKVVAAPTRIRIVIQESRGKILIKVRTIQPFLVEERKGIILAMMSNTEKRPQLLQS
jgi:hypothetical protein